MQVIQLLYNNNPSEYGITIAASLLAMLPPLIIFAFAQDKIVQGVALSGIK